MNNTGDYIKQLGIRAEMNRIEKLQRELARLSSIEEAGQLLIDHLTILREELRYGQSKGRVSE